MEKFVRKSVERIRKQINGHSGVHIVSTSLNYEWKGNSYQILFDTDVKILNPDMFVIIYDDVYRVRDRISKMTHRQNHKFSLGEVANWRREEINLAYKLSSVFRPTRDVQLVAYETGPTFLKDVIWSQGREKIYLSHPITGEGEEFLQNIYNFGRSLSEYYVVFDPTINKDWNIVETWREIVNNSLEKKTKIPRVFSFSIEYSDGILDKEYDSSDLESAIKNLRFQVVDTDYRLIRNCSFVVVFHPRESISSGVMCEMIYAKSLGKLVYAFYPYEPSLFFEWYSTRIFTDKNEFKSFLIKESSNSVQKSLSNYQRVRD